MTMQTVEDIIEAARSLPAVERRRLIDELDAMGEGDEARKAPAAGPERKGRYAGLLALAGTVRSDVHDVSADKYRYVADGVWKHKRG
jgi:hypothetical protein